jgi:hypothetical protein
MIRGIINQGGNGMNWAWCFGMIILTGVPAIVGGGLAWHIFEQWTPVIVWEIVLLFTMSFVISKGGRNSEAHH